MSKIVYDNNIFKSSDKEVWRPVVGFAGYEISNQGRVKSFKSGRAKILKQTIGSSGYPQVRLSNNGKIETTPVHTLVLEAFVGKPIGKIECNHKNGIKTDNRLVNLEWVTHSENVKHAYEIGLMSRKGEKNPRAKLTNEEVLQIRDMLDAGIAIRKIAEIFKVSYDTIRFIKAGRTWSHVTGITPKNHNSKNSGESRPIILNLNFWFGREAI